MLVPIRMMHQLIGKGWLNTVELIGQIFRFKQLFRTGLLVESHEWKHSRSKRRFTRSRAPLLRPRQMRNVARANGT